MPSHSNPDVLLSFILLLIIASFTAYYANRKGRNPLLWFVIGILLGIFAPLILLFLSPHKGDTAQNGKLTIKVSNPDSSLLDLSQTSPQIELKPSEEDKLWYYLDQDHQQMGPVSLVALRELWNRGQLELNSYVWSNGMEEWQKVEELPELKKCLSKQ